MVRPRPDDLYALGRAVKSLRVEAGVTRADLAESAGISYSYLAEIENGVKSPSTKVLSVLARALGVESHDLMARSAHLHQAPQAQRMQAQSPARMAASEEMPPWLGPDESVRRSPVEGLSEVGRLWRRLSTEDREMVLDMMRRLAGG